MESQYPGVWLTFSAVEFGQIGKKVKVANLLPAIVIAVAAAFLPV